MSYYQTGNQYPSLYFPNMQAPTNEYLQASLLAKNGMFNSQFFQLSFASNPSWEYTAYSPEMFNFAFAKQQYSYPMPQEMNSPCESPRSENFQKKEACFQKKKLISKEPKRKKADTDPQFRLKNKKKTKKIAQDPSRNKNSNIFRSFLKLISCDEYRVVLDKMINSICLKYKLESSTGEFLAFLKENSPKTTNYINKKQFGKLYRRQEPQSKLFRIIFHSFVGNTGRLVIIQMKNRLKLKEESLTSYFAGLRVVENQLNV